MPRLPSEISRALDDAAQALCQNRSHVVLVADTRSLKSLPSLLAREISDRVPVKLLDLDQRADVGAIETLLAGFESSLVLLVSTSRTLDPGVLRHLGKLSMQPGSGLRVALFVDRSKAEIPEPAAPWVRALGVGALKIEVGGLGAAPAADPRRGPAASDIPPVATPRTARRPRPFAVRSVWNARRRARRRQAGTGQRWFRGLLLLAIPAILWAGLPAVPDVALAPSQPAQLANPQPLSLPRSIAATPPQRSPTPVEAEAAQQSLAPPQPAPTLATQPEPQGIATVPVSLNAHPWAQIEIDGTALGPTPIGDWPLAPGLHQVRASFPNGVVVERSLQVDGIQNHFQIR